MKKLLFVDTEFSHPDCLLTGALVVTNADLEVLDTYEFALKHETYLINPGAIEVNGINIQEHHKIAAEASVIEHEIKQFIKKHATVIECNWDWFEPTNEDHADPKYHNENCIRTEKLVPIGHNIRGDVEKILENFPNCKWREYCKRNPIDTIDLFRYAQVKGKFRDGSLKLQDLAAEFNICEYQAHDALNDCYINIEVLRASGL